MSWRIDVEVVNATGGLTSYYAKGESLEDAKRLLADRLVEVADAADLASDRAWRVIDVLRGASS